MNAFAELAERLADGPEREATIRRLRDYLATTPDPERGFALALLAGAVRPPALAPARLRDLLTARVDPVLLGLSEDYVGDLAETVALLWPGPSTAEAATGGPPGPAEIVAGLAECGAGDLPELLAGWLDRADPVTRRVLLRLAGGRTRRRALVPARLVRAALARFGGVSETRIEELWHGLSPPYAGLFAWLEGEAGPPRSNFAAPYRPVMEPLPLEAAPSAALDPALFAAEWQWDGLGVQLVVHGGDARLYDRAGDDISAAFPDLLAAADGAGTLDGELTIRTDGVIGPRDALRRRLGRKTVTARTVAELPATIRAYDLLFDGDEDLRPLPFRDRRARLEDWLARHGGADGRLTLSPLLAFADRGALDRLRQAPPAGTRGLVCKRLDSTYEPGHSPAWLCWRRARRRIDAVLMYARRGQGALSTVHADLTVGVWRDGALVPIGAVPVAPDAADLDAIDGFVRENVIARFGPVREVVHEGDRGLVLELAFDGVERAARRRAGLQLRGASVVGIRPGRRPDEAARLAALEDLLTS
ncbi:cisplatin damage response ATP-dependent DNA ligase [Oceanibacterium hippocampi]|uniref:ATP-dependent DNA ligase n=1 Tax=Oceanibacterium hippocampi TaxID=745714 RepID=A0A1Y5S453_9PROT|nr:cisplatin damage response ATP-dependent DNA ligase [Oceanibacterium hippocampi]SLN29628.1 ATP-dependent DNA ligase [Oceanibacterium hippocampi]